MNQMVPSFVDRFQHDYSDQCVCVGCQGVRAERRAEKRKTERLAQREANQVTRYGSHLINLKAKEVDGTLVVSRSGVAYRKDPKTGTISRMGSAIVTKEFVKVQPHGVVKGKAARKAEKRARRRSTTKGTAA